MHLDDAQRLAYLGPNGLNDNAGDSRPDSVLITDCTTREGEQAANVSFSTDQKVDLIGRLAELGVHQAQAGYPAKSRSDYETVEQVKRNRIPITIEAIAQVMFDNWQEEIDAAIACGPDVIDLQCPCSDLRLTYIQHMTREEMLERSLAAVEYARNRGPIVRFAATDTTRGDLQFVKHMYTALIEAGVERITIADTAGAMHPGAMSRLVREISNVVSVPIQIHCHDDYGLALANTLAAVEAGASIADATINGLGERSGNTSLDELVIALTMFFGYDLGIHTQGLTDLARHVAEFSGVPLPQTKQLVGENAFAHKLEGHVRGVLAHPALYEPLPISMVGNERKIPIGKYSGPAALRYHLAEMGVDAEGTDLLSLQRRVEQRSIELRRELTRDELRAVVSSGNRE